MIVIVDYMMGNPGAVKNMVRKAGAESIISHKKDDLYRANKIILPGVGSFDQGMIKLKQLGLIDILSRQKDKNVPILGICLGMQLLSLGSEEGSMEGLGWVKASFKKFAFDSSKNIKVPHMGWNIVRPQTKSELFPDCEQPKRFYFVHSFYAVMENEFEAIAHTNYGLTFVSAFKKNNIFGVQFHPEKSHKYGLELMRNFLAIN